MSPAIPPGSLIAVAPLRGEPLPGDVVAYRDGAGGRVIVHRVLRREGEGVRTAGDANALPDPSVVVDGDLLGRVCWASPLLGRLARCLRGE